MAEDHRTTEVYLVHVVDNSGRDETWPLHVVEEKYPRLTLTLTAPWRAWTATGTDVFGTLMELREHLDSVHVRLCCNGARRNAWASGMQRDMGRGRVVYLVDDNEAGRPRAVRTLEAAPCDEVVTVHEQKDFYAVWLAERSTRSD
jgi:hypothetical protein